MKQLRAVLVIAVAIVVVLVAHHFIRRSQPQQRFGGGETLVAAEVVGTRSFADRIEAIGTVSANESVTITPAATERVAGILFEDGARVAKGDVLVELEHTEEAAAVEEARIELEDQTREFERVDTLHDANLVSQEEFDLARGDLEAARARLLAARARLDDRIIRAPFAGVLGIRRVSPGTLVSPGDVITTLDDLSTVKIDFTVPEALLSKVAVGQRVQAECAPWPDEIFEGRLTSLDSRVEPTTRAVAAQARIPNPRGRLRTGMLMTVELTCRPREAPSVPERALLSYADRQYVFVVGEDAVARQREVKLGARDVGWVEVVDGLSPGDTVVVDGLLNLRDGARVSLESAGAAPAASSPAAEGPAAQGAAGRTTP